VVRDPGHRKDREPEARETPPRNRPHLRLSLLEGFKLEDDGPSIILPEGSQRLLAFLALKGRSVRRHVVAGTLWPVATQDHASSSLRSALARLQTGARAAVKATAHEIGLSHEVTVDLWDSRELAHRLLAPEGSISATPGAEAIPALSEELLPDWHDEWVLVEAEDWRQLRLHSLEALAERLTARRQYGDGAAAALAAVRAEPLRESPRAALIGVHIAEGNPSEAVREFARYGELLRLELGMEPTERLRALVADLAPKLFVHTRHAPVTVGGSESLQIWQGRDGSGSTAAGPGTAAGIR
jgi:DNA-binding SARP family transcriptional activator